MSTSVIAQALLSKVGFDVVQASGTPRNLRLLGRIPQSRMPDVLALLPHLLQPNAAWGVDVSKMYFVPEGASHAMFAWRFIFETKTEAALPENEIAAHIRKMDTGCVPLQSEIPLRPGFQQHCRYDAATGRGVLPAGQEPAVGRNRR